MDELKLNFGGNFMKGILTRIIRKAIKNKLGCEIDIRVNSLSITNDNGKTRIHADVDAEIENDEFVKIIKDLI